MLIKDSIILIQKDEHEFDELIYYLKDYYHIIVCPYDYTDIKIKAIDSRAWMILCSFKGVKQNDFWDKAKEIDNLIVLSTFKELAYHASDKGDELECYLIKENDCRCIADYILYKDCLLSEIDSLIENMSKYRKAISEEDVDTLRELLEEGSRRKEKLG